MYPGLHSRQVKTSPHRELFEERGGLSDSGESLGTLSRSSLSLA